MGNWISLWRFSGWMAVVRAAAVLWVGVGCAGGEVGGGDADAAVAEIAGRAMAEVECVAKNSECLKATWTNLGTCEVEPKTGLMCGDSPSVCTGICSDVGTCVGPGPELHCGSPASPCSLCDGKGRCGIDNSGATCTPAPPPGECFKQTGTCNADGKCELTVDGGAACTVDPGPCGAGICSATGFCLRASEGQPCKGGSGTCRKYEGNCDASGTCVGTADTGASCKAANPGCGSGVCSSAAVCVPLDPNKPCTTSTKQDCRKSTGVCGPKGQCEADIDEGAACTSGTGPCGSICTAAGTCVAVSPGTPCASTGTDCPKLCTPSGGCAFSVGADCTVKYGECAGKTGVCSTSGYCLGVDECAKPYIAVPTGDFEKGLSCSKIVGNIPAMPPVNSGTCGNDGDPCRPKFCKTLDSDATFTCKVGQLNDGTPCPGDAANPCAASTCQAGKCTAGFKPAGTACKPLVPSTCGEFQCSSAGKCEPVPASVPLAAPCTVSDGDTDCWAKSCDGQGNCTKVPRAKGEHCGAELDNACAKFACDGKGRCLVELLATNGQCKDAKCLDFYAKPGTPCTGGPCTDNGCTSLGICATSYKPVGAPCEFYGYPGTCDENHVCVWPAKVMGAIVGTTCYGTFPCMKEDVAYGADGVCHGTVAVGAACGSLCNPGICGADGSCKQAFAPKGAACGGTSKCGKLACDGKGGCGFPEADVGKACPGSAPVQCNKYGCDTQGQCVLWPVSDTPCTLANAVECHTGVCAKGVCAATPSPGPACGKDTACMTYSCSASGQCAGTPKTGASCESTEVCKVGVCDATGQCKQVVAPGAKCVGKQQCMEGTCNASGGCDLALKPAGSQCTAAAPGTDWSCYTGVCDSKGGCSLKINTGAKCKKGAGPCTEGVCQSDASCKKVPANLGQACSATCVPTGVCNAVGECAGNPATGQTCYDECVSNGKCSDKGKCTGTVTVGSACGAWASAPICQQNTCDSDGSCTTKNLAAGKACTVGATFYETTPSYACGSSVGACDGAGTCLSTKPDPDGTACGFDDGCAAAHVCKGGFCVPVEPMDGNSPCKFGCATGKCIAGVCDAPLTLQTKESDPCNDGDPCTDDVCGSSGLPYSAIPYNWTPAGKCSHTPNSNCINGKLPKPTPICPPCGNDLCGSQMYCKVDYAAGTANCVVNSSNNPYVYEGYPPECDDKNPCTKDGCANGGCFYTSNGSGGNCAPFKHCKEGKCIPWN